VDVIAAFNRMQRFDEDRLQMVAAMSHDLQDLAHALEAAPRSRRRRGAAAQDDRRPRCDGRYGGLDHSFARDDAKREPRLLVDLHSVVAQVCEDAADAGEAVTYKGRRGTTILGRPVALKRVVTNLVDNAVKYAGGAEVALTAEPGRVVVAVEDRGPGIPRSQREKVFEPFYRVDDSRNPDTGGAGLALSVARSIVREHGGDVVRATRKGGGLSARLEPPA
jgi:signal transduction histidine kinase